MKNYITPIEIADINFRNPVHMNVRLNEDSWLDVSVSVVPCVSIPEQYLIQALLHVDGIEWQATMADVIGNTNTVTKIANEFIDRIVKLFDLKLPEN